MQIPIGQNRKRRRQKKKEGKVRKLGLDIKSFGFGKKLKVASATNIIPKPIYLTSRFRG
jgi:hypothetical protein